MHQVALLHYHDAYRHTNFGRVFLLMHLQVTDVKRWRLPSTYIIEFIGSIRNSKPSNDVAFDCFRKVDLALNILFKMQKINSWLGYFQTVENKGNHEFHSI